MTSSIYLVESIQYKAFSYSFTSPQVDGGYHLSLPDAQQAMRELPPQVGRWVLISKLPIKTPYPERHKQALELYEWRPNLQQFILHEFNRTPAQRFVFRAFGFSLSTSKKNRG